VHQRDPRYAARVIVRDATREDIPTLVELALEEAREAEGREVPIATLQRGIATPFDDPRLARSWVLERDGQIVGSIAITTEWSDWNGAPYWYIQNVFLRPAVRGSGALALLVDAVDREATRAGAAELRLLVHPLNARAMRAYHKLGFADLPYRVMSRKPAHTGET